MSIAIAIPARYGSTRFPGKPLAEIAGRSMIGRVMDLAQSIVDSNDDVSYFVTTDDKRIADHVLGIGAACIMTPPSVPTGSDRVLSALRQFDEWPDFVINLQGDAPFTPPHVVQAMIDTFKTNPRAEVITPVHRLSWDDLDRLREMKTTTPFSGTTAVIDEDNRALWFSKNIIPAIRKEDDLRETDAFSPVHQHMGLYGFRTDVLEKFCALPQGTYEELEGLEQLRMIENGIKIQTVPVQIETGHIQSGIDTPEDVQRAEEFLKQAS